MYHGAYGVQSGAVTYTKPDGTLGYKNKGVARANKAMKREEAEARNAATLDERRRKNRDKPTPTAMRTKRRRKRTRA